MKETGKILTIARYTFREALKSKILYNVLFLGLALLAVTYVAQQFTYGSPGRIALDFGMGALSLSSVAIAVFMGVGLLSKEIENRTVYMVVSRPVKRSSFVLGRIAGLGLLLVVNVLILASLTLAVYFFTGGSFQPLLLWTLVFILFEAGIMLLAVSFFSLVTSNTLAVILSLAVYVSGHAIHEAQATAFAQNRPLLQTVLEAYQYVLPAFGKINTRDMLIYQQSADSAFLIQAALYSVCYGGFLAFLSLIVFERKNLN